MALCRRCGEPTSSNSGAGHYCMNCCCYVDVKPEEKPYSTIELKVGTKDNPDTRYKPIEGTTSSLFNRCKHCNQLFPSEISLKEHVKDKHTSKKVIKYSPNSKFDNICGFCDLEFTDNKSFHDHILKMHNSRKYRCALCEKIGNNMEEVAAHLRKKHSIYIELGRSKKKKTYIIKGYEYMHSIWVCK
ncbi:hypothetical protein [Methanococcoides alaskense]|uniref:C2H2 Zn-finger protein n=1 Tax=Methanococcoides alaskense TaxID=325778 RepID=A0AA90Z691_9EURY|nr:hypothetical protein [Methanococcoides alaskense]MDA0525164.1 hypothetical protein [Methanococcoides alaskense]MDR6221915.1 putative C2H2 Zn-finger protein [Methanococcoides alaskense]